MCLKMRGIDHQHPITIAAGGKLGEYLVEHSQTAPADKTVVNPFMGPVGRRRIAPAKPIADNKDDTAQYPPVINPWNPARQWAIVENMAQSGAFAPYSA